MGSRPCRESSRQPVRKPQHPQGQSPLVNAPIPAVLGLDARRASLNPRTRLLLEGRIVPTLLRMAWPNVLVMVAQAATGLIETWFVSRLGIDALAGMALVFPGFMMMQMLSAGGGGRGTFFPPPPAARARRARQAHAPLVHAPPLHHVIRPPFFVLFLLFLRPRLSPT